MEIETMMFKLRQTKGRRTLIAVGTFCLLTGFAADQTLAQTNPSEQRDEVENNDSENNKATNKESKGSNNQSDACLDDECPELGVIAGSCPGKGVCVLGTMRGGPADEAGLQHGDYILSIDDKKTDTPMALVTCVKEHKAGDQVQVKIWRQGEELTESVVLACEAKERPKGDSAWIGVHLTHSGEEKSQIVIEDVQRNSPAQNAGLQAGDIIKQVDGKQPGSFEAFVDDVQDVGAGQELPLTIERNGQVQEVTVKVGRLEDAPVSWQRRIHDPQYSQSGNDSETSELNNADQSMERILDDLRQRIRSLEQQIQQGKPKGDATSFIPSGQANQSNAVAQQILAGSPIFVVAQNARNQRSNSRWGRNWQRGYSGNNWHNRGWDSSGNNHLYRSPRYGNSYYNYRGMPYYNNGAYRNRYQSGFRISPGGISYYW